MKWLDKKYLNTNDKTLKEFSFKVLFMFAFVFYLLSPNVFAREKQSYFITNVRSEIELDITNRYYVSETYDVTLNANNKEFIISIPFDKDHGYLTKISDIVVQNEKYTVSRNSDEVLIKIKLDGKNQANQYSKTFNVSYTVDKGADNDKVFDYVEYDLVSRFQASRIASYNFNMKLPKGANSAKVETFIVTEDGSEIPTGKESVVRKLSEGFTLNGSYSSTIENLTGYKLKVALDNGYFDGARDFRSKDLKLLGLYFILMSLCFIIFFFCGKDSTLLYSEKSEIPSLISPIIAKSIINMDVNSKDENKINDEEFKHLSSLLFKWANLGYINIERTFDVEHNINEYKVKKLRDVNNSEMPYFEKMIYDSFFVLAVNDIVDTKLIKDNIELFAECIKYFRTQRNNVKEMVLDYVRQVKANSYDKKARSGQINLMYLSFLSWMLGTGFECFIHTQKISDWIMPSLFLVLIFGLYFFHLDGTNKKRNIYTSLGVLALGYFMTPFNIVGYLILSLTTLFVLFVRKYSFEYELSLDKIKGFKRFLKRVNREKIVNLLDSNPKYFYEAMPYAIALGETEKLVNVCREFKIAMPGWFAGMHPNAYSIEMIATFEKDIDDAIKSIVDSFYEMEHNKVLEINRDIIE